MFKPTPPQLQQPPEPPGVVLDEGGAGMAVVTRRHQAGSLALVDLFTLARA
jgi:hypothetical protein